MTKFDFLDDFEEIIVDQFNVLDDQYARDMAQEALGTLIGGIEHENEIRYVLIDGHTGQLESRRLFEEYQEALDEIKDRNLERCLVGTLFVEMCS